MDTEKRYVTLSQLQGQIKDALCDRFRAPVWVMAEIGEIKVNSRSGHCYMQLVEKGGANGVPQAQVSAIVWSGQWGMLSSYFAGATGQELHVGMKVMLSVCVVYHELYGLSLRVVDIDPLYTLGDLERQRMMTIARLMEDGIFDLNRELGLPSVSQRIAVVSSSNAAGYQDFMNELDAYIYRFDTTLFEAVMQGHGAEESIIDALGRIACRQEEFDVVVIIRGGGSQSDLSFLNSYLLSFHIAQFPLPVVAGLGHDKDQSVVDMVAALSLKTPTAVAAYMVERLAAFDNAVGNAAGAIKNIAGRIVSDSSKEVRMLGSLLKERSVGLLTRLDMGLSTYGQRVLMVAGQVLDRQKVKIGAGESLIVERASKALAGESTRILHLEAMVRAVDPQSVLARGFAIVRMEGKALTDVASVNEDTILDITLHKGKLIAKVVDDER